MTRRVDYAWHPEGSRVTLNAPGIGIPFQHEVSAQLNELRKNREVLGIEGDERYEEAYNAVLDGVAELHGQRPRTSSGPVAADELHQTLKGMERLAERSENKSAQQGFWDAVADLRQCLGIEDPLAGGSGPEAETKIIDLQDTGEGNWGM